MSIVLIWAFVVIAGAPPSLVRAAIMCTLMTVSQIVSVHVSDDNRHINIRWGNFLDEMGENGLINSLSIAAIIMLVYDPFMLFDIGFQLSFMSMLGLCLCRDIAARIMRVIKLPIPEMLIAAYIVVMLRWVVRAATGVALTSIICTVFTFPLVAYYFGTIPTMSVLTNILISLPAFALLVLAAAWWICAPVAVIQALIGKCLIGTADVMNGVTRWVSAMDNAVIEWHPTLLHVILVYVLIAVVGMMYSRMVRKIDATRTI
jgi:competence protein ComEC